MHWFVTCVAIKCRPHDCKLNWRYSAALAGPQIIQSMLAHGACVDARTYRGRTPLISAVLNVHSNENKQNSQNTIEKLIAANSDLNAVNEDGNTALMLAVLELRDEFINLKL